LIGAEIQRPFDVLRNEIEQQFIDEERDEERDAGRA